MPVTITKEQLHRIPTDRGAALVLGIFLVQFDSSYPTGGEEVDLSGYMKQVLDMKVQATEDSPGYVFDVDDTLFSTAKPKIEAYWSATSGAHSGAAVDAHSVTQPNAHAVTQPTAHTITGGVVDVAAAHVFAPAAVGAMQKVEAANVDIAHAGAAVDAHAGAAVAAHTVTQPGAHAAAALAEVTNGADLSAVKARCLTWGIA